MIKESISFDSLGVTIVGTLFVLDHGEKFPALIFSHGAGDAKEDFFEMAEFLAGNGFAALCIDMHGHGGSGGEHHHVKMSEWVPDLRAAIDFLEKDSRIDKERIGAMGLSSGGTAILETAVIDKRLRSLVALDATVRADSSLPMIAFRILNLVGYIKKFFTGKDLLVPLSKLGSIDAASDPELNEKLKSSVEFHETYDKWPLPGGAESFLVDTIKRVGKITAPTLVLWGEDDKIDPPETAKILFEALLCKKELHIIEGNGHVGHMDRNKDKVFTYTKEWFEETL